MCDYFTNTKGLNNLIWMNPQCGSPSSAYWPGSQKADLAGGDTYDSGTHQNIYDAIVSYAGSSMPIALHENGPIPDPDILQSQGPKFVMFCTWNNEHLRNNGADYVSRVYNHAYVITRDELPDFNSTGPTGVPTDPGPTNVPTPAPTDVTIDCSNAPQWDSQTIYENAGTRVIYNNNLYENNWYSQDQNPEQNSGANQVWTLIGTCDSSNTPAPTTVVTNPPTTAPTNPPTQNNGDVNGDGTIDIVDALLIAQFYVDLNPSNFNQAVADVNCSGGIDIVDALLIAQLYVDLISTFPC